MAMIIKKHNRGWLLGIITAALLFNARAQADCAGDGQLFTVKEGIEACIMLGKGHKIVHCSISGLQQSSYLLVTHTDFIADSPYHTPQEAIYLDANEQRVVFTGFGVSEKAHVVFHYFGPWDPSYQFDMTCSW